MMKASNFAAAGRALPAAILIAFALACAQTARTTPSPGAFAMPGTLKIDDAFAPLPPQAVQLGGLLGARYTANEKERLLRVDEDELLAGFRHRPGKQAWIGEHVGKFLHAGSLAWANTRDPELRAKIDRVASELIKTQEADGYLGTYTPETRFQLAPRADWDVWVHKYCLMGLLTYHQSTGDQPALEASRKIGDLLIATFGPGKKSILSAGTHVGMAATSVLEPTVLLYRATGQERYLAFAKYIVEAWDEPGGPKIIATLMAERSVQKTANGKAYEMLSNLNGLCELYRSTGDRRYLEPVLIAWDDIVARRLYITGTGSSFEHWQKDGKLPNGNNANVGETCVTVTWLQINAQLLRLTGEPRFAERIEQTVYNHLLGAQRPDGEGWCYYTPLDGFKPYGDKTNCCLSSGPRGVALLPTLAYSRTKSGVAVNLYGDSRAEFEIGGKPIVIEQKSGFPLEGRIEIALAIKSGRAKFALSLRIPEWADGWKLSGAGGDGAGSGGGSYATLDREWKDGDTVALELAIKPRIAIGGQMNEGRAAAMLGSLALAADAERNSGVNFTINLGLATDDAAKLDLRRAKDWSAQNPVWETDGFQWKRGGEIERRTIRLVPFYNAGADGKRFSVWLRRPGATCPADPPAPKPGDSLFAYGEESRSRVGNVSELMSDGDSATFTVTFDGDKADEDWFAVAIEKPARINRVVFGHGKSFHDGGWFDASAGKPRVEVRASSGDEWKEVGKLESYPATTASDKAKIADGARFEAKFPAVEAVAIRAVGKPACGDDAGQAFSSCSELQAFFEP